jgi:hypothetical protein
MAQVIKIGDPPQTITGDPNIIVEHSFPDNTYSVQGTRVPVGRKDKTNFWQYVKDLFGVVRIWDVIIEVIARKLGWGKERVVSWL